MLFTSCVLLDLTVHMVDWIYVEGDQPGRRHKIYILMQYGNGESVGGGCNSKQYDT